MPNQKQPPPPKSTDEILREMEEMSRGAGQKSNAPTAKSAQSSGGGLKSLLDFFVKVVPEEEATSPAQTPGSAPTGSQKTPARPPQRVGDLVAGEAAPKFAPPKNDNADLSQKSFEEIYREAGLGDSPCTVDELETLMENPTVANQPLSVKVIAVNLALSAKGISPGVPLADAVRRDRALDAFQAMLADRASASEQRNLAKIQQLTQETEEYLKRKQAEMEALRSEIAEARRQSVDFSVRRETEEKRLANLITPFLEGKPNPVTIGNQSGEQPLPLPATDRKPD